MTETQAPIRLTSLSHGAGCGCKIAPAVLEQIIKTEQPETAFAQLLVGNSSKDDAAVYETNDGNCIISTTDFFMPIVDDAFDFGRIASANAISDVYAMGGKPMMAIAILGWPVNSLPADMAAQVLQGSRAVCAEAGIPLAGGHSIDSPEPFFGLAVTGTVHRSHLKQNNTAEAGDLLFLTKPVGVGVLSTAMKRGALPAENYAELLHWLSKLNSLGEALGKINGVHAMTDVTGFGLAGHLIEMAEGSGLTALLDYNSLKMVPGVKEMLAQHMVPDATYRNWNGYGQKVGFEAGVNVAEAFKLLPDPQTNGGLLIAVAPDAAAEITALFEQNGLVAFTQPIGTLVEKQEKVLMVK